MPWWKAIHPYVSPRTRPLTPEEEHVRAVAYGIKTGDRAAIETAALAMAAYVEPGSVVVPAPASKAATFNGVLPLAARIAALAGGTVGVFVARVESVPSSHQARRLGGTGTDLSTHFRSMERVAPPPPDSVPVAIVDNVAVTGATLSAVASIMGRAWGPAAARAVVWAESLDHAPVKYEELHLDGYRGQNYYRLVALDRATLEVLGKLEFSTYGNELHVGIVEVSEKHQRKGIGSALLVEAAKRHPDLTVRPGMMTDQGGALWRAVVPTIRTVRRARRALQREDRVRGRTPRREAPPS